MKKSIGIVLIVMLVGIVGFFSSCTRVTTEEYATVDRTTGSVDVVVRGFYAGFLTPEGPFPGWSRRLQVRIHNPALLPTSERTTFSADADFSSSYDMVESGTLTIDPARKTVFVDVKYTKSYSYESINGEYKIRE